MKPHQCTNMKPRTKKRDTRLEAMIRDEEDNNYRFAETYAKVKKVNSLIVLKKSRRR